MCNAFGVEAARTEALFNAALFLNKPLFSLYAVSFKFCKSRASFTTSFPSPA
jgi:hypothetical protein